MLSRPRRARFTVAHGAPSRDHRLRFTRNRYWVRTPEAKDADHHRNLRRLARSVRYFGPSHPVTPRKGPSNRYGRLPSCRASGPRMRIRLQAHPVARSVGPLALGPLHSENMEKSISRKHVELRFPPPCIRHRHLEAVPSAEDRGKIAQFAGCADRLPVAPNQLTHRAARLDAAKLGIGHRSLSSIRRFIRSSTLAGRRGLRSRHCATSIAGLDAFSSASCPIRPRSAGGIGKRRRSAPAPPEE
jgi:hypothetical protein